MYTIIRRLYTNSSRGFFVAFAEYLYIASIYIAGDLLASFAIKQ
jgi:hypothetical protein